MLISRIRIWHAGLGLVLGLLILGGAVRAQQAAPPPDEKAAALQEIVEGVRRDPASASPQTMIRLIAISKEADRPQVAAALVKSFLAQNFDTSPELILAAAEIAELSGDVRAAVTRYKQYLKSAPAGTDTSGATLQLYRALGGLGAADDRYRLMTELGARGRTTPALKRYDRWYLDQARDRRDVPGMAARLAAVMADRMPLELERLLCWGYLDWLMGEMNAATPEQYAAVPDCRKIAGLIRENPVWTARFRFLTENLAYFAGSSGKDPATLDRDFDAVAAAARAYLEAAPTAAAMRDVAACFGGGGSYNETRYRAHFDKKAALFPEAFARMSEAERNAVLSKYPEGWHSGHWVGALASREGYGQLMAAHADFFRKSPETWRLPLKTDATDPAIYKKLAPTMQQMANHDALVVASLGAGDDLYACWRRTAQDSWFLDSFSQLREAMDRVKSSHSRFPRAADQELPQYYDERTLCRFGAEELSQTPVFLFDSMLARNYATAAWKFSSPDYLDKSKVAEHFDRLSWIPYAEEDRQYVFDAAQGDFRKWAESVRKQQNDNKGRLESVTRNLNAERLKRDAEAAKTDPKLEPIDAKIATLTKEQSEVKAELAKVDAAADSIAKIEEMFRRCTDPKQVDPNKAPNELCRNLARAMVAQAAKNQPEFVKAARAIYAEVRNYREKRIPFGRAAFLFAVRNRLDAFDTLDLQLDLLAAELAAGTPESGNHVAGEIYGQIWEGRHWPWNGMPAPERDKMLKLNAVLAKSLRDTLAKNKFSESVFNWFLVTRRTSDWNVFERDPDIMEQVLARKDAFATRNDRGVYLLALTRGQFPTLREKYPPESWFDDLIVEDMRKSRQAEPVCSYDGPNHGGRDEQRKIANALAEVFQTYERLPFGFDNAPLAYRDIDRFWQLQQRAMGADAPVRDAMLTKLESYGGKTRFDLYANGGAGLGTISVRTPEGRKQFFDSLSAWIDARNREPMQPHQPLMSNLSDITPADLSNEELDVLIRLLRLGPTWNWNEFGDVHRAIFEGLVARNRTDELFPLAPALWTLARQSQRVPVPDHMVDFTARLAETGPTDLAATYATAALNIMGDRLRDDQRSGLMAVRASALSGLLGTVAVNPADPRFPLFQAQANYHAGKFEEAWQSYLSKRALLSQTYRELDPTFSIWLIGRMIDVRSYADAEDTCRTMIAWVDGSPQSFAPEDRARLLLVYAEIFFARQEYPRARAICEQVAAAGEFDGTRAQRDAGLRIVTIDRLAGQYDRAGQRLETMLRDRDEYVQTEANYQYALLKFDQKEYPESREYVDKVLAIAPSHANARILEGKLYLRMKKLVEATVVRVGLSASQQTLVPGKPLKITLEDRNLGIVGRSVSIDIRVWTASGDEETFSLLPFGDSKTKFEGQIATALAPMERDDGTLQVLGGDAVHFDYSEAFKEANHIAGDHSASIRVVSDSELYASSGRILSREEQEEAQLEAMIRRRMNIEQTEDAAAAPLSVLRDARDVKPGNRINIRVVDPDRSTTDGKDQIIVRVTASSGDRVQRLVLQETDTHSGVFEGAVETTMAPATAFALDSEEGKEPNFAITGAEYPPWVALPNNQRPKWFSVDLNNSVALGELKIVADVPGRQLKGLVVQTSLNGRDFQSVCAWPRNYEAWQGAGQLQLVRLAGPIDNGKLVLPQKVDEYRDYLEVGCLASGCDKITVDPPPLEINFNQDVNGLARRLELGRGPTDSSYIGHLRLSFYQPRREERMFKLVDTGAAKEPDKIRPWDAILTVDGKADSKLKREVNTILGKGYHRLDVYFRATTLSDIRFRLEDEQGPCTPDTFAVPDGVDANVLAASRNVVFEPAAITNSDDNGEFTVSFQPDTTARTLRLRLLDFETDAPAIRRLHLSDADGTTVLPTEQDVVKGKENTQLEVVPGDRITIAYEDPSFLTKTYRFREAFMNATFYNADLSACFVESSLDSHGNRKATYIEMRRFKPGDTVNIFIKDPDGDVSEETDTLEFTARVGATGKPVALNALETEPHSGVFLGRIFPVEGAPQRPSELQMAAGDDLELSYFDAENTDPGIPWERKYTVEQTYYVEPELRIYEYSVQRLPEAEALELAQAEQDVKRTEEYVPVRSRITVTRPEFAQSEPATVLLSCPLAVEVLWPTVALSRNSQVELYVQTAAGRELKGGDTKPGDFDIQVPGTVRLSVAPSNGVRIEPPKGYAERVTVLDPADMDKEALDTGQFTFHVPVLLGTVASASRVDEEPEKPAPGQAGEVGSDLDWVDGRPVVRVRGDDELFLGFSYTDAGGNRRWLTASAKLLSDPMMDVMDRRYQRPAKDLHVGETLYYRVIDPGLDLSDDKDTVTLQITAGEEKSELTLAETFAHSGEFKCLSPVLYSGDPAAANTPDAVTVNYGDPIAVEYRTVSSPDALSHAVQVFKGGDGTVQPFTKRFADTEMAVQTHFTVAEAYFEMAKNHRKMGQEDLARREIGQGKKLLEEALRDHPETEARAHAEYLLANLALEFSEQVKDAEQKSKYQMEAVSRFMEIVATYPDSPYAPKSQFKKALTYEKMGRIDDACEEYVKLSYRYPDNELVAETIARLGQYFLTKGKGFKARIDAETDLVEQERIRMQSAEMFTTAAEVFGRLAVRFPDHKLAGKTTVLSGQCYMRAEDYDRAIDAFNAVIEAKRALPVLIAEAMYWCADSHTKRDETWEDGGDMIEAYRVFKKLTWDYPETDWAKYARGRLSEPQMAGLDAEDNN